MSEIYKARSAVAHDVKARRDPTKSRQQLAEAKLAAFIEKVVSSAPPLTQDQRDRLAVLLRGSAS